MRRPTHMIIPLSLQRAAGLLLGLGLCLGIAGGARVQNEPGSRQPLVLSMQVEARQRGAQQFRIVQPGESLRSGDQVRVWVEVDRAAYVRVAVLSKQGTPTVLLPLPGAQQDGAAIEPRVQTAVPPGGAVFELDEETGEENIEVMASTRPIVVEARAASQARPDAEGASPRPPVALALGTPLPPPPPPPPPPPYPLDITERGLKPPTASSAARFQVQSNARGIAVARFPFQHAAARAER